MLREKRLKVPVTLRLDAKGGGGTGDLYDFSLDCTCICGEATILGK